ncbi:MAG: iron chelate uptake ABC transporter family permease subunit, partial [Acidiferrobacterales bacterium]
MMVAPRRLTLSLVVFALACLLGSLAVGSVNIDFGALAADIVSGENTVAKQIVLDLRLPRTLTAFAVGGLLALAGALLQVLLRNPLADPYILGVSGGAAVATLSAMLAGLSGAWISGSAFVGSLISISLVFGISRASGGDSKLKLLLTGVIVAAGWGAIISLILSTSPSHQIYSMLFWLMGDLSYAQMPTLGLIVLIIGLAVAWWLAR